ncbi:hypothetical protein [Tomitella gaofuii]|nr:hypothetical protein [Tomitella gaofuii]
MSRTVEGPAPLDTPGAAALVLVVAERADSEALTDDTDPAAIAA